jgi:hypothetical protein
LYEQGYCYRTTILPIVHPERSRNTTKVLRVHSNCQPYGVRSVSISEALLVALIVVFELDLTAICLLVRSVRTEGDQADDDESETAAGDASV